MRIKIIILTSVLFNVVSAYTMNEEKDFWDAVVLQKYTEIKSFLDYNPSLVNSRKTPLSPIIVAVGNKDVQMLKLFLSYGANIYIHDRMCCTPIYEAVNSKKRTIEIVQLLIDRHADKEDPSYFGFYGEETLKAVKKANNPAITSAFNELQERKKIRDEKARALNQHTENKQKRLFDFVQLRLENQQIEFLMALKRDQK